MPHAKNADINIYYEVEGKGPPLLMHDGLGGGLEDLRDRGYVDALKDDYRVILMDARGHGKSDKPHDPEMYNDEYIVGDVIAVLNSLGIEKTNFYGYSYGGSLAYGLAKYTPGRVKSLIAGGNGGSRPSPEMTARTVKMMETGMEALVAAREKSGPMPPGLKARTLASDSDALIACCKAIGDSPPIMDALPGMSMPFLLLVGESDWNFPGAQEVCKLLPDCTFVSFPGLDHMQAFTRLDLVIPHIKKFLSRVNQTKTINKNGGIWEKDLAQEPLDNQIP